jgi:hypothetical protein
MARRMRLSIRMAFCICAEQDVELMLPRSLGYRIWNLAPCSASLGGMRTTPELCSSPAVTACSREREKITRTRQRTGEDTPAAL